MSSCRPRSALIQTHFFSLEDTFGYLAIWVAVLCSVICQLVLKVIHPTWYSDYRQKSGWAPKWPSWKRETSPPFLWIIALFLTLGESPQHPPQHHKFVRRFPAPWACSDPRCLCLLVSQCPLRRNTLSGCVDTGKQHKGGVFLGSPLEEMAMLLLQCHRPLPGAALANAALRVTTAAMYCAWAQFGSALALPSILDLERGSGSHPVQPPHLTEERTGTSHGHGHTVGDKALFPWLSACSLLQPCCTSPWVLDPGALVYSLYHVGKSSSEN